jgi:hypothetical protein
MKFPRFHSQAPNDPLNQLASDIQNARDEEGNSGSLVRGFQIQTQKSGSSDRMSVGSNVAKSNLLVHTLRSLHGRKRIEQHALVAQLPCFYYDTPSELDAELRFTKFGTDIQPLHLARRLIDLP